MREQLRGMRLINVQGIRWRSSRALSAGTSRRGARELSAVRDSVASHWRALGYDRRAFSLRPVASNGTSIPGARFNARNTACVDHTNQYVHLFSITTLSRVDTASGIDRLALAEATARFCVTSFATRRLRLATSDAPFFVSGTDNVLEGV